MIRSEWPEASHLFIGGSVARTVNCSAVGVASITHVVGLVQTGMVGGMNLSELMGGATLETEKIDKHQHFFHSTAK